jgi:hypothetical protein
MQRDSRMTKPTNMQNVRGGDVKRRAETAYVSRNSMRSNLPGWRCGKEGHISHFCNRETGQREGNPKETKQGGNFN